MSNRIVWGIQYYPKKELIDRDSYCIHSNFKSNDVICDAKIHVGTNEQNFLDATFEADVLTGQSILGQWTYDVDAEGKHIMQKRKYRILSMSIEFEEIKEDK